MNTTAHAHTRLLDQTLQTVLNVANASLLPKLPEKPAAQ